VFERLSGKFLSLEQQTEKREISYFSSVEIQCGNVAGKNEKFTKERLSMFEGGGNGVEFIIVQLN
jgi:hypothetical protein